jgi:hypothetical protein
LCFLISSIFLCEFECTSAEYVGLLAGRYSGTSRPDLYRTPQALQSVLGPAGPARHCGVFSAPQCWHFLPIVVADTGLGFLLGCWRGVHQCCSWHGMSRRRVRRRLLRARTGTLRLPQQLIRVVLLLLLLLLLLWVLVTLLSSTDTGLWCLDRLPGCSDDSTPKNVSIVGNESLFDIHSSSSSAISCVQQRYH